VKLALPDEQLSTMTSRRNPRSYETSPLLPHHHHSSQVDSITDKVKELQFQYPQLANALQQIIPVIFAVFINLLDAVTFGTCFFPAVLGETSSLAIDLFLFSTFIVQIVLIVMSSFQCGLGTSMAENIPFIHTMALGVYSSMQGSYSVKEVQFTLIPSLTRLHSGR
jgi:hypothetical protein